MKTRQKRVDAAASSISALMNGAEDTRPKRLALSAAELREEIMKRPAALFTIVLALGRRGTFIITRNRRFSMKLATAMFTAALALAPGVGLAHEKPEFPPNNPPNSTIFTVPLTVSPGRRTA